MWTSALLMLASLATGRSLDETPPNIVLVVADDLGWGELGCYGQEKIRTPRIDALAAEGMRFTRFYSGAPVCAPSRCVLLSGKHSGHATIRNNSEVGGWGPDEPEGQGPIPDEERLVSEILAERGYRNAAVGKWGLGGPGSTGHPNFQGFDLFYGYLCQRVAHNYYPTHLWRNHDVDVLDGNRYFRAHQKLGEAPSDPAAYAAYASEHYAPDRMLDAALEFVDANAKKPFFLYYPSPVPHVALQVPEDSLAEYEGAFEETPYLGQKGYLPHPKPRAAYAAMITRFDRDVGRIVDRVAELGLAERTLFLITSDNGATYAGGADPEFFRSCGPLRGLKGSLFEGGVRVPLVARWQGTVEPGGVTDHLSAFQDVLPTLVELSGAELPPGVDGKSFLPTLLGREQPKHERLYFEFPGYGGQQAVITPRWKALRRNLKKGEVVTRLYDLEADPAESTDVADEHPDVLARMEAALEADRVPSERFPLQTIDGVR